MTIEEKRKAIKDACSNYEVCADCPAFDQKTFIYHCFEIDNGDFINECYSIIKGNSATEPDNINHPTHYQEQHECIDVMRVMFGDEAVKGFCKCNAYKYRFRAGNKDGNTAEQDIAKAEWYENYLFKMGKESE